MTPEEALTTIYTTAETNPDVVFISRGDNSGTHSKEKAIWTSAGYNYTTDVEAPVTGMSKAAREWVLP